MKADSGKSESELFDEFKEYADSKLKDRDKLLKYAFDWLLQVNKFGQYLKAQEHIHFQATYLTKENEALRKIIEDAGLADLIPPDGSLMSLEEFRAQCRTIGSALNNVTEAKSRGKIDEHWKDRSEDMNDKRHEGNRATKNFVLEDWRKNKNNFPSAAKAGRHYSGLLVKEKGIDLTPDTITKWIRDYASEIGIKLR